MGRLHSTESGAYVEQLTEKEMYEMRGKGFYVKMGGNTPETKSPHITSLTNTLHSTEATNGHEYGNQEN